MDNSRKNQRKMLLDEIDKLIENYHKYSINKIEKLLSELEYEGCFGIKKFVPKNYECHDIKYLKSVREIIIKYEWICNKNRWKSFMKNVNIELHSKKGIREYCISNDYIYCDKYVIVLTNRNKKTKTSFVKYIFLCEGCEQKIN